MSADFEQQHSRTLLLPQLELSHLEALAQAEAWVIGLGGLGAAVSLYLASAGVGRLHLVDGDRVELSNLPRQTLYGAADVGRPKAAVAAERLLALNPARIEAARCIARHRLHRSVHHQACHQPNLLGPWQAAGHRLGGPLGGPAARL